MHFAHFSSSSDHSAVSLKRQKSTAGPSLPVPFLTCTNAFLFLSLPLWPIQSASPLLNGLCLPLLKAPLKLPFHLVTSSRNGRVIVWCVHWQHKAQLPPLQHNLLATCQTGPPRHLVILVDTVGLFFRKVFTNSFSTNLPK